MATLIDSFPSGSEQPASIVSQLAMKMIETVAQSDKPLSDLIMAAAIPHRFNIEILETLKSVNDTNVSIDKAVRRIKRLSFVKEISQDMFSYHEDVRSVLLQLWHSPLQLQNYVAYSDELRIYFAEQENTNEMLYHWFAVDPDIAFVAHRQRLQALIDRRDLVQCEVLLRLAEEQVWEKSTSQAMWLHLGWAALNQMLDRWEKAVETYQEILSGQSTEEMRAIALNGLGSGLNYLGRSSEAKIVLEEATELFKKLGQPVPDALLGLGWAYFRLKKWNDSLYAFRNALSLAQAIEHLPAQGWAWNHLGTLYFSKQQWGKSKEHYQKALEIRQKIEGEGFFVGRSFQNLANVHLQMGELELAFAHAEKALDIQEKTDDLFGKSFSLEIIGVVFEKSGNLEKSVEYLNRSLVIRQQLGAVKEVADTFTILSRLYKTQGLLSESTKFLAEANALKTELGRH